MSKELTINLDDELYTGLIKSVGEKNVSRFIESVLRSHLKKDSSEIYDVELPLNDGKKKVYLRSPRLKNSSQIAELKIEMIEEI
jgi:hypothetical protein